MMSEAAAPLPNSLHRVREMKSNAIFFSVAACPIRPTMLVGSSDASIYEFDLKADGAESIKYSGQGHRSYVTSLVAVGASAVSGGYDGQLVWWDLENRQAQRTIQAHSKWIRRVVALPDGDRIASIADDMYCRIWDMHHGKLIAEFTDHEPKTPHHFPSMLYALAVSSDGRWLATGDRVGHIAIWDSSTWMKVANLEAPVMYTWDPKARRHSIGGIRSLAFSPDGNRLIVGGTGKINNIDHLDGRPRLEVFDWRQGKRIHEFEDDTRKGIIEQISWRSPGNWVLCAGGDHKGFLSFYNPETNTMLHQKGTDGHIHGIAWDATMSSLFVAAHERTELWTWS